MSTTFKPQQVLRTKVPLKTETGAKVSPGTRTVVMRMVEGKVKAKVVDPNHPTLAKARLLAGPGAFNTTHRGRPKGE